MALQVYTIANQIAALDNAVKDALGSVDATTAATLAALGQSTDLSHVLKLKPATQLATVEDLCLALRDKISPG